MRFENMTEGEPIRTPTETLPRTWNNKLLPGYLVVAVDERDPDHPDCDVTNPDEKPKYPDWTPLLNDPHYVRFKRLEFEAGIYEISGKATLKTLALVFSALPEEDVQSGPSLPTLIRHDYQASPRALIDKLS